MIFASTVLALINKKIQHTESLQNFKRAVEKQAAQSLDNVKHIHDESKHAIEEFKRLIADIDASRNADSLPPLRQALENLLTKYRMIDYVEIFNHDTASKKARLDFVQGITRDEMENPTLYNTTSRNQPANNVVVLNSEGSLSIDYFALHKSRNNKNSQITLRYSTPIIIAAKEPFQAWLILQVHGEYIPIEPLLANSELILTASSHELLKRSHESLADQSTHNQSVMEDKSDWKAWLDLNQIRLIGTSFVKQFKDYTIAASAIVINLDNFKFNGRLLGVVSRLPALGDSALVSNRLLNWGFGILLITGLLFLWFVRLTLSPLGYLISAMTKSGNQPNPLDLLQYGSSMEVAKLSRILKLVKNQLRFEENSINVLNKKVVSTELRSKHLIETIPSSIIVVNTQGEILIANKHTAALFGYEMSEISGQSVLMFIPERFRDNHMCLIQGFFKLPEHKIMGKGRVLFGLRKDGSEFPVEIGLAPLDLDGEHLVIANVVDMTLRMHYEEQILRAKEEAVTASELKSEFVANVSHEIRTPMNALVNLSKLALKTETKGRTRDYLLKIYSSSRTLLSILNEILDFSKLEAGKMEIERTPFRLQDVLQNVYELTGGYADEKPVKLIIQSRPGIPETLVGDPLRISQVICNLVNNSLKFTEKGEIKVMVDMIGGDGNTGLFRFSVNDTGIGMSIEQQQRLFTAFSQADSSISRRYGGTGLGLKICKQLVELMGGQIAVSSVEGEGSHFSITLTLEISPADLVDKRDGGVTSLIGSDQNFLSDSFKQSVTGMHLLVAEDNDINQQIICEILQDAGINLDLVFNGAEAMETLLRNKDRYDAVLMDVQMPVMDGLTATREIRAKLGADSLPIIAMTARASQNDQRACLDAGMNDHIAKPIEDGELFRVLSKWRQSSAKIQAINKRVMSPLGAPKSIAANSIIPDKIAFLNLAKVRKKTQIGDTAMLRILKRFRDNNRDFMRTLVSLLNTKSWDIARLQVHNIKGTAGYTGADALVEQAKLVEKALETAAETGTPDIRLLEQAHGCVIATLDRLLINVPASAQEGLEEPSENKALVALKSSDAVSDIMNDISEYLRDNNLSVRKELLNLKGALGNAYGDYYKELEHQIDMLNFVEAQQTVKKLSIAMNAARGQVS